jgi:hypothetical protein
MGMLSFAKARQIAEVWIAVVTDDRAEIVRDLVEAKPHGWVFHYQSSAYPRDPGNALLALAGNAPFIVDRVNGEIRVLGPAPLVNARLAEYEAALPAAALQATP